MARKNTKRAKSKQDFQLVRVAVAALLSAAFSLFIAFNAFSYFQYSCGPGTWFCGLGQFIIALIITLPISGYILLRFFGAKNPEVTLILGIAIFIFGYKVGLLSWVGYVAQTKLDEFEFEAVWYALALVIASVIAHQAWLAIMGEGLTSVDELSKRLKKFWFKLIKPVPGTKSWISYGIPKSRHLVTFTVSCFAVAALIYGSWYGFRQIHGIQNDQKLVSEFPATSAKIYSSINNIGTTDVHEAAAWRGVAGTLAAQNGLDFMANDPNFTLCATFATDASQGAEPKDQYGPQDVPHHHSEYQCFTYAVPENERVKPESFLTDQVVKNTSPEPGGQFSITVGPSNPTSTDMMWSNFMGPTPEIIRANGQPGTISDLTPGKKVNIYRGINILSGQELAYKIIIQ